MPPRRIPATGRPTGPVRALVAGVMTGAVVLATLLAGGIGVVGVVAVVGAGPAGAAGTSPSLPGLDTLVLSQPMSGYTVVPGPSDGPLTAAAFASQSADPAQATSQFNAMAAEPGFAAYTRLWVDRTGSGAVARDVAELLFRIPDAAVADRFAGALGHAFAVAPGVSGFTTPGIPGAVGYSVPVQGTVKATEQIVILRTGPYVSMLQFASNASADGASPLTPTDAVAVSRRQYLTLAAAVAASTPAAPATSPTVATPAAPVAPAPSVVPDPAADNAVGRSSAAVLAAAAVVAALVIGTVVLLLIRRRRRTAAVDVGVDPFAEGGILAAFGAVVPPASVTPPGQDPWAVAVAPVPPRPVPAELPDGSPSADDPNDESRDAHLGRVTPHLAAPQRSGR